MPDANDAPRAFVVLVVGHQEISLGAIGRCLPCDLALIDDLLRLQVSVAKRGWSIRLTHVDHDLRELVEFVGVSDHLGL